MIKTAMMSLFMLTAAESIQANTACLLEGKFEVYGMNLEIKDCVESKGLAPAQLKQQCEGMSQAATQMGAPPAKITYLKACPTPFQGKCDNSKTAKTVYYYYKREKDELKSMPQSCKLMGGTYTAGTLK